MRVINKKPQFFWLVKLLFPEADWEKGIIMTYRENVYCKYPIPNHLMAHEEVHVKQQRKSPLICAIRYWLSPEYRLRMEIPAHQAEYRAYTGKDREAYLETIAHRLSSPLYKNMISFREAKKLIQQI